MIWFGLSAGCSDSSSADDTDSDTSDNSDTDSQKDDTDSQKDDTDSQSGDTDTSTKDTDTVIDSDVPVDTDNEWGFEIRTPQSRVVSCENSWENTEYDWTTEDVDWLCSFDYDGTEGVIYIQNTPTACKVIMMESPIFTSAAAQIWTKGNNTVEELDDAVYDWGGNHHNDSLQFTFNGTIFKYYHSSFGFGWRSCNTMDCIQILNSDGSVKEDGCGCDRALPIVCKQIQKDGTYAELTDDFEVCLGDSCLDKK
ncbi:MAG: hypothetical protein JXR91_02980 [Deltaproteobacteria bacterium]|nr:hypothetical protein [Deltaproteobacteria bacterium]